MEDDLMSDIYVFSSDEESNDYSTMGLVGALTPTSCVFEETANGESLLTLEHPKDEFGRFQALVRGNIIVAPVPVRTTPEIQNGSCVTTVWTYKVKSLDQLTSKKQRTLYKKSSGSGKMKYLNAGDIVTVVYKPNDEQEVDRWKVKTNYGTGWMYTDGLELVTEHIISDKSSAIEEIQSPWKVTPQYFRIYEVQKSIDTVTVSARHISYDLLYDTCHWWQVYTANSIKLQEAIDGVIQYGYSEKSRNFTAHTNVDNEVAGMVYRGKTMIDCFLNEEDGICAKYDVSLVRDNYDLYFLHEPGVNRGVKLIYGKNLTGVDFTYSDDEVATRIVPIGETKDGYELGLGDTVETQYVDSPLIDKYPVIHVYWYEVDNCKVGDKDESGSTITQAIARARMRAAAQKLIDDGCDQPTIEMSVEFVNLGDTEEYKDFKDLENAFLFDYVIVQHPDMDIDVTAQITKISWDCLLDKMDSIEIGQPGKTLANSGITTWQIPSGFSGTKIASGTIDSVSLKSDAINARHMQADSINTDALQAACVTAVKLAASSVTADKLDANTVDVKVANIVKANLTTANIQNASINWAEIDTLNSAIASIAKAHITDADIEWASIENLTTAVANITKATLNDADIKWADIQNLTATIADVAALTVKTGEFELADIQHLLSSALILKQGIADSMLITNLAVTSANLLNATIDKLVLKGSDEKYYHVFVGDSGDISTKEVTVTEAEIEAGQTSDGRQITVTNANITELNAQNVKAKQAVFDDIFTEALTAGKITANEAFIASATIPILYTTALTAIGDEIDISANSSINFLTKEVDSVSTTAVDAAEKAANALQEIDETKERTTTLEAQTSTLQNQVSIAQSGLNILQTESIPDLEGRVKTIESGVHIEGSTIGIYASDSPYKNTITNDGWIISEDGQPIITCAETKLSAPRVQVTDAFIIGDLAWKPGSDKHLRLLKYGR
jgi:phage minor structural protein